MNLSSEAMEMEAPIRGHRVALRQDPGKVLHPYNA